MKPNELTALNALHDGQSLAAATPAAAADRLAWVGVYPLNLEWETTRDFLRSRSQVVPLPGSRVYRIRAFEVQRRLIEEDASISEPDLENLADELAYGDAQLTAELERLGVKLEQLALPYQSDYPI